VSSAFVLAFQSFGIVRRRFRSARACPDSGIF
jgi:hypothetical protein